MNDERDISLIPIQRKELTVIPARRKPKPKPKQKRKRDSCDAKELIIGLWLYSFPFLLAFAGWLMDKFN